MEALVAANFSAVKLDNPKCGAGSDMQAYYDLVHRTSPHPVVIENCHYNTTFPHWVDRPGGVLACPMSLFRVSNDIKANWASVMANVHATLPYAHPDHPISSPGCWSYPGRCKVDPATPSFPPSRGCTAPTNVIDAVDAGCAHLIAVRTCGCRCARVCGYRQTCSSSASVGRTATARGG
eukprot:COSAG01_NODE_6598_length_3587_cov_3.169725_5_plen_179_part_00